MCIVLDQNVFDQFNVHQHSSENELCDYLQSLNQEPLSESPQRLFRGQVARADTRYWPPINESTLAMHSLEMEMLQPSDYRSMEQGLGNFVNNVGLTRAHAMNMLDQDFGDHIAGFRALLTTYLVQRHLSWTITEVENWWSSLQLEPDVIRTNKLLSIGQHYGLRSHLLDCTSDWQVAIWFATHSWNNPGNYVPGGNGVLYEFLLDNVNQAFHGLSIDGDFSVVDIRNTPPVLAPRARSQMGFSIAGFESPHALQAVIQANAITVHVFPRSSAPSHFNSLARPFLVPPHDDMAILYENCRAIGSPHYCQFLDWFQVNYPNLHLSGNEHSHLFV